MVQQIDECVASHGKEKCAWARYWDRTIGDLLLSKNEIARIVKHQYDFDWSWERIPRNNLAKPGSQRYKWS